MWLKLWGYLLIFFCFNFCTAAETAVWKTYKIFPVARTSYWQGWWVIPYVLQEYDLAYKACEHTKGDPHPFTPCRCFHLCAVPIFRTWARQHGLLSFWLPFAVELPAKHTQKTCDNKMADKAFASQACCIVAKGKEGATSGGRECRQLGKTPELLRVSIFVHELSLPLSDPNISLHY